MLNNLKIPDVSVVVLCYKTGSFAQQFAENIILMLEKENIDYELLLVGNYYPGSQDTTPDVVKALARKYKRTVAITEAKEGEMGWDMKSGLRAASGRYIVVIDGDGQMPYEDILRVYKMIKNGNFDLCKTYRFKRYDSLYRRFISMIYNFIFSVIFMIPVKDANSKPKIMTRKAYDKLELLSDDWFIDAEILIQARRFKFRIGEIPTVFEKNIGRTSFVKIPTVVEFIRNIIFYRFKESMQKHR